MSNAYIIQKSTLDGIGDAIREKTGGTDLIPLVDMGDAIRGIQSGGDDVASAIISRTITEYRNDSITSIGSYAFYGCLALTTVDFPLVTSIRNNAFYNSSSLTTVNTPQLTSIEYNAFYNCNALTSVDCSSVTSIGSNAFNGCISLTSVDIPLVTSIPNNAFYFCARLTSVILRNSTVVTLTNKNAFTVCYHFFGTVNEKYNPDGLKDGYFYVPSALVESYKTAANWSDFATQFRALEDYTVDGTITGELDPNKI